MQIALKIRTSVKVTNGKWIKMERNDATFHIVPHGLSDGKVE